jgi:hypothetical protein
VEKEAVEEEVEQEEGEKQMTLCAVTGRLKTSSNKGGGPKHLLWGAQ